MEHSNELTDTSPFPFGAHKNKPIQDVPVNYLHWLYHNAHGKHTEPIKEYIKKSLDALKLENKDLIWK